MKKPPRAGFVLVALEATLSVVTRQVDMQAEPPAEAIDERLLSLRSEALGAISEDDARFILGVLKDSKPGLIVEIGTASGFSTLSMALARPSSRIVSLDWDARLYADTSKPVGFLIDEFGKPENIRLVRDTSVNVSSHVSEPIDLAFIDGAHEHPWPTLDALFLWPLASQGAPLLFHDLDLYRNDPSQVGPKFLYDQIDRKFVSTDARQRVFSLRKAASDAQFLQWAIASLLLPWSLKTRMPLALACAAFNRLKALYPEHVADRFATGYDRFA